MRAAFVLPSAILLLVLLSTPLVLMMDGRRRRLLRRLEGVTTAHAPAAAVQSIRLTQQGGGKLARLGARLFRIPLDLPNAHVLPPWAVPILSTILAVVVVWFGLMFVSPTIAVMTGVVAALLSVRTIFGWEHDRYTRKLLTQLPDTVELLISATRAGLPAADAFQAVAREMPEPTGGEFGRVVSEMALGRSPAEALMSLHLRTKLAEYAIFSVTLGVQTRSGGRLAETMQNLADTVRQRLAIAARAQALSGEAKLSARGLSAAPILFGAMQSFLQPGYLDPLFHDPRGKNMFVFGVVTLILGALTMRHIIGGVTRE